MAALRIDLRYQRECERMSVCELEDPLLMISRETSLLEEGPTFLMA
jgi:hypothetical protein